MTSQTYHANYANAQKSLGMVQALVWVPAEQVPLFLASAEEARIAELERALASDDDFRIKVMAARNRKLVPQHMTFDAFFSNHSYFMKGGKGHKQALEVYSAYVAAVQNYAALVAEVHVATTTRSMTLDRKAAEAYVSSLRLAVAQRKGSELADLVSKLS